MVTTMIIF